MGRMSSLKLSKNTPLSVGTDIWSLGAVIWDMLHTHLSLEERSNLRAKAIAKLGYTGKLFDKTGSTLLARLDGWATPQFSNQLIKIMEDCYWTEPTERMQPLDIRDVVEENWNRLTRIFGDFSGDLPERLKLSYKDDEFPLHARWSEKKRRRMKNGDGVEHNDSQRHPCGKRVKLAGLQDEQGGLSEIEQGGLEMSQAEPATEWRHLEFGEYDTDDSGSLSTSQSDG